MPYLNGKIIGAERVRTFISYIGWSITLHVTPPMQPGLKDHRKIVLILKILWLTTLFPSQLRYPLGSIPSYAIPTPFSQANVIS